MHAQPKKPFHWPDSLMNSANLPATTAKEEGRPFFLIMPPATRARRSASVTWARQHAWWGNNWQISRPQSRRKSLTCSNPFPPLLHNCQSFTGFASFSATFTSAPPPSTTSPRTQIRKKSKIKVGARAGDFFPPSPSLPLLSHPPQAMVRGCFVARVAIRAGHQACPTWHLQRSTTRPQAHLNFPSIIRLERSSPSKG